MHVIETLGNVYIETKKMIQRIPGFLAEEAVLRISLKGERF